MIHGSRPIWQASHILLFPPQAKLWAYPLQVFNDFLKRSIAGIARVIRAASIRSALSAQTPCVSMSEPFD